MALSIEIQTPLFIRARDLGELSEYPTFQAFLHDAELIDIKNDEYEGWDSRGTPLLFKFSEPKSVTLGPNGLPQPQKLADAIKAMARDADVPVDIFALADGEFSKVLLEVKTTMKEKKDAGSAWKRFINRF